MKNISKLTIEQVYTLHLSESDYNLLLYVIKLYDDFLSAGSVLEADGIKSDFIEAVRDFIRCITEA